MDKDTFTLNNQTYSDNNNILLGIINELQHIVNSSHENLTIKRISDVIIKMNFIINENKKNRELIMNQFTLLQTKFVQLNQIANSSHENLTIKRISDVIIKMNFIINENKKTRELIMNQFTLLQNQISKLSQNLKINNINDRQELKFGIGRYVGQVVNGLKEGKGTVYFNDGDRYEGDFRNDKYEGKGIYYYNREPFKGERFEGDFRNGIAEGKGVYYYHNGDRYEGDYRNDKPEGKGIMYYHNGDRYEGDFRNDKREGKGIYYFHNGNRYEGDFRNDGREGKGIYYYNNGDRMMGDYYNGKKIGKHVKLTRNGEVKTYNY